jgi:hypothetical protein
VSGRGRESLMGMLVVINAALLAGLIVTVWRLRRLHVLLSVEESRSRARLEWSDRRGRHTVPAPSGLDEFPEERSLVAGARHRIGSRIGRPRNLAAS